MPYWLPQMQKKHSITTLPHHRPMILVPAGHGNGVSDQVFFSTLFHDQAKSKSLFDISKHFAQHMSFNKILSLDE